MLWYLRQPCVGGGGTELTNAAVFFMRFLYSYVIFNVALGFSTRLFLVARYRHVNSDDRRICICFIFAYLSLK